MKCSAAVLVIAAYFTCFLEIATTLEGLSAITHSKATGWPAAWESPTHSLAFLFTDPCWASRLSLQSNNTLVTARALACQSSQRNWGKSSRCELSGSTIAFQFAVLSITTARDSSRQNDVLISVDLNWIHSVLNVSRPCSKHERIALYCGNTPTNLTVKEWWKSFLPITVIALSSDL